MDRQARPTKNPQRVDCGRRPEGLLCIKKVEGKEINIILAARHE